MKADFRKELRWTKKRLFSTVYQFTSTTTNQEITIEWIRWIKIYYLSNPGQGSLQIYVLDNQIEECAVTGTGSISSIVVNPSSRLFTLANGDMLNFYKPIITKRLLVRVSTASTYSFVVVYR